MSTAMPTTMKMQGFRTSLLLAFVTLGSAHPGHHHHHHNQSHDHRQLQEEVETPRTCGTHEPTSLDTSLQQRAVQLYKAAQPDGVRMSDVVVPVCFHVIKKSNGEGDLTTEQLQAQLDALTTAYSSASCCDQSLAWCNPGDCSLETSFRFEMAVVNGAGNLVGGTTADVSEVSACVTRTTNNNWAKGSDESGMKSDLQKGGRTTLNIYTIDFETGFLGHSSFPWDYEDEPVEDGVVVQYSTFPNGARRNYDEGDTLVHEIGHWLGLLVSETNENGFQDDF
jgi:hypothetical protein